MQPSSFILQRYKNVYKIWLPPGDISMKQWHTEEHALGNEEPYTLVIEHMLPAEHARLVRLCTYLTGDHDAAENLAQETLIEAWR